MLRFNRIVCVVLVCALAAAAYPAAVKSREMIAAGLGEELTPDVDGMIIMNFHDSNTPATEVQIKVTGLEPGVTYGVQVDPGFTDPLAFTTSASGNGSYHGSVNFPFDISAYAVVRIFEWDGVDQTLVYVSYDELRAYGCVADTCSVVHCDTDADCDSGFDCLRDTCEGGLCFHESRDIDCDDNDPCTADFCNGVDENGNTTCEHIPIYDPPLCDPF
ncbi:MAG: hypothetical protein JSU68_00535 [Phycisphaerales bacterium]|nr:MAG: hypothetical protein JSU68_00535 [Phycisphaerales bacterium]